MSTTIIPEGYRSALSLYETQLAIGMLKNVFAEKLSAAVNNCVDGANGLCRIINFVKIGNDRLLIGDGDVEAVKLPLAQEIPYLLRLQRDEPVGVVPQQAVDFWGKAVAQLAADEPAVHQQITSL